MDDRRVSSHRWPLGPPCRHLAGTLAKVGSQVPCAPIARSTRYLSTLHKVQFRPCTRLEPCVKVQFRPCTRLEPCIKVRLRPCTRSHFNLARVSFRPCTRYHIRPCKRSHLRPRTRSRLPRRHKVSTTRWTRYIQDLVGVEYFFRYFRPSITQCRRFHDPFTSIIRLN